LKRKQSRKRQKRNTLRGFSHFVHFFFELSARSTCESRKLFLLFVPIAGSRLINHILFEAQLIRNKRSWENILCVHVQFCFRFCTKHKIVKCKQPALQI